MNRIKLYSTLYIITFLFYIFFRSNSISDTIVFVVFLVSSVVYVFTQQGLADAKYAKNSRVHSYNFQRTNNYGNISAIGLGISTLLYFIISINFEICSGIIILIIWPFTLFFFQLAANYARKNLFFEEVYSYISLVLEKDTYDLYLVVKNLLNYFINSKADTKDSYKVLTEYSRETGILDSNTSQVVKLISDYISANDSSALPDEINELNRIK